MAGTSVARAPATPSSSPKKKHGTPKLQHKLESALRLPVSNGHVNTNGDHAARETDDEGADEDDIDDYGEGTSSSPLRNGMANGFSSKLGAAVAGQLEVATLLKNPLVFVPAKHADEANQKLPYEPLPSAPPQANGLSSLGGKGKGPAALNGTDTSSPNASSSTIKAGTPTASTSSTAATAGSSTAPSSASTSVSSVPLPLKWPQAFPVGPGYENLGNTCFLNSTLQALTHTAPLVACLMGEMQHSAASCKLTSNNRFCVLCAMQRHVKTCFSKGRTKSAIEPAAIVRKLSQFAKGMRVGRQEDAHEFLRFFVDGMQNSAAANMTPPAKTEEQKEKTFINRILGGKLRSRVSCSACKHNSDTYDSFMDISLDVSDAVSIKAAFQNFVKVDQLHGANKYKCEKCKKLVNARKQFTINKAPQILHIHLKRFTPTGRKIVGHVNYSEQLSLQGFMSEESEQNPTYRLYGVVCHSGQGPHSGHYFAHVRSGNNKWHCMNDSSVREISTNEACAQRNAYLLFYERTNRLGDAVGQFNIPGSLPSPVSQTVNGVPSVNGKRKERDEDDEGAHIPGSFPAQRVKTQLGPVKSASSPGLSHRPQQGHLVSHSNGRTSPSSPRQQNQTKSSFGKTALHQKQKHNFGPIATHNFHGGNRPQNRPKMINNMAGRPR